MKHINILLTIVLSVLALSCQKFLTEENPGGLAAGDFYVTEAGAESGVKSCYSFMRLYYGKDEGMAFSEYGTDLFTSASSAAPEFDNYNVSLDGSSSYIASVWQAFYLALNTCNELIEKLPKSSLSKSQQDIRLGEVRFLRAFYLWHIVNMWGGVVLNTTPTKAPITELHRSSVDDFYKVIKDDLAFAVANCPETSTDYGRVTKGAAQALSARVYLYTKDYAKALEFANAVISSKKYSLANDYKDIINMATCNTVPENIFVCNYATQANNYYNKSIIEGPNGEDMTIRDGGNNLHMFFSLQYDKLTDRNGETPVTRCIQYSRPMNRYVPTLHYLDSFNETIDSRYDALIRQEWICNNETKLCKVGDVAIRFTKYNVSQEEKDASAAIILDRSFVYNEDGSLNNSKFNCTFTKFEDPTRAATNDQSSPRDAVIIRLPEMYFIAAEAAMNLNDKGAAADYLNVIRRRAAFPGHEKEMEITKDQVDIDFILDEKGREMAGECFRWFDLVRTGKLLERVKKYNMNAAQNIKEYHTLRPIPQTTLDAVTNPDEFKQNPGY